jgi:hypothetical protein
MHRATEDSIEEGTVRRVKHRRIGQMRVFDDALSAQCFNRLRRRVYGTEGVAQTFDRTFWFDFSAAPDNVVALAILEMKALVPRNLSIVGAEWWLSRMRTSHIEFGFHQDRDGGYRARTGKMIHPDFSSVLFLNRCRGGALAVTAALPDERNTASAPSDHSFWLAVPRPNRFALFPGHLTHGVLDSHNEIPGPRRPKEKRLRLAVAINFWSYAPERIPSFSESRHYRVLSIFLKGHHACELGSKRLI